MCNNNKHETRPLANGFVFSLYTLLSNVTSLLLIDTVYPTSRLRTHGQTAALAMVDFYESFVDLNWS